MIGAGLLLAVSIASQVGAPLQKVLVMDLRANAVPTDQVQTLQSTLVTELSRVPGLEVLSGDDVRNLVQLEASKQVVGCDVDGSCLAEIADALGANLVVFGDVGKLGALLVVNLSLFDASKTASVARTRLDVKDLAEVPTTLPDAVLALVGPVLSQAAKDAYQQDVTARLGGGAGALRARSGPPLYVVAPKVVQMAPAVGATVSSLLAKTAEQEGFRAFTVEDAQVVLSQNADLQLLGADADGASLGELGKAIGVRHVLATIVSAVDGDVVVQARLIDVERSAIVSRREVKTSDFKGGLVPAVEAVTRLVLQPVFADERGMLKIDVSEEGANILVDDQLVGVTPLRAPLNLAGGHHLVAVEKEGFVRHAEALRMTRGASMTRAVSLRPSIDFVEQWRTRNGTLRVLAWGSTVTGAAGLLVGGIAFVPYVVRSLDVLRIDEEYRSRPFLDDAMVAEHDELVAAAQSDALFAASFAATGTSIGLLGAGLAAFFWIYGDDPGRYDEFAAPPAE